MNGALGILLKSAVLNNIKDIPYTDGISAKTGEKYILICKKMFKNKDLCLIKPYAFRFEAGIDFCVESS